MGLSLLRPLCAALFTCFSCLLPADAQPDTLASLREPVLTLSANNIGVAAGDRGREIGGRLLFSSARYHAGDDPAWAAPDLNDEHWEIASVLLQPDNHPRQGWPGIGWFRIRLRLDASLQDRTVGFAITHAGAIEAYLDGKRIYRSGTVGVSRADETPEVDLDPFILPLEPGREYVLALRYSSFVTQGFRARWYSVGPGVWWGDWATMLRHRRFVRFNQGVFSAFFLAFALLFGLLFALYRSERLFFYLALYFGLMVPFSVIGGQLPFVKAPGLWMPLVDVFFTCAVCALLAMLLVLYAFFYPKRPRTFYGFLVLGGTAALAVVLRLDNVIFYFVLVFLVNVEVLRIVGIALWRRKRWAWIIGVGVVPGLLLVSWEQLDVLGLLRAPWTGTPFNPGMISTLFFSSACAVYVGIRFAEANRALVELEAARRLQLSMLPQSVPDHPEVELSASMQTASEVGGDYYDFDLNEDGTLTVAIGDATGHGTEAGIMVTAAKSLWNAFSGETDLEWMMHRASLALKRMRLPKLYMAMAVARLRGPTLELIGAGLPPALIYRSETGTVETVPLKGLPLGSPGPARYRKQCVGLSPGDTVVLMTDGFPERFSPDGQMLGYERAQEIFAEVAPRSPQEIIEHFTARGRAWSHGRPPGDDVTFVVMKRKDSAPQY